MVNPIAYRLYKGWLEIRIGADEHWHQYRKTNSKEVLPITQRFGRDFIYTKKERPEWVGKWFYKEIIGTLKGHNGIDMEAPNGTCLYAPEDGVITEVNTDSYGKSIRLKSKEYEHIFGHLEDFNVSVNQRVKQGQLIGWCDNTGKYTTGSHLHWGVRPVKYDRDNGYAGYIDQYDMLDFKINMLPYRDGMFLQRTDTVNGGNGEVYEIIEGQLQYCDTKTNPAIDKNHLIHKVLRLLKDGIEPKSITSINEKEFNKYKNLIV